MSDRHGVRRTPQQERSHLTVDRILDSAEKLFARDGFERTSTNAIADAAGVPIGSIYQYFGNKEALAVSLADRFFHKLQALHRDFHSIDVSQLSVERAVDVLLDPMVELHLRHPAYSQLLLGARASKQLAEVVETMDEGLLTRIRTFLEVLRPTIARSDAERSALVILTAAKALLHTLESAPDEATGHALAAESKRMLAAYARQVVEDSGGSVDQDS